MKFTLIFHDHLQSSITTLIKKFGCPSVVIEIGVFEGNTTFNLTSSIIPVVPTYKHYAIDPYNFSADLKDDQVKNAEALFRDNLENYEHKDNIEFMHMSSKDALLKLYAQGVKANLIYIDGDHRAATVLEDLVLGFNLLQTGGVMLCDDCVSWKSDRLQDNPKLAVDAFISCYWDKVVVEQLDNGFQIAIRKL
jgi:hypothetical protein